jgi:hypothetical protein
MSTSTGWVLRTLVVLALVAGLAALTVGVHAQDDGGERNANREVPDYDIAIDCAYDPGDDRTECTFGARAGPGTKDVGHLDVPDAVACAAVVGGDYEAIDPDPNTGVIGFKSKGGRGSSRSSSWVRLPSRGRRLTPSSRATGSSESPDRD